MEGGIKYPMVASEYDRFWVKYCGFLDLSLGEFMAIQQSLLFQQLQAVAAASLGQKILGKRIPATVNEFRDAVPLTTYQDYLPYFGDGNGAFPDKPYVWAHTSASSNFKQVPYTYQFYNTALDNLMAVFILACSKKRGQSSIVENDRVLFNVEPSPCLSGILAHGASEKFNLRPVISPDSHDGLDPEERISKGFEASLQTGMDILIAKTNVLVKMGHEFSNGSGKSKLSGHLLHPGMLYRYARAMVQSKMEKRSILPGDLWPVKAIISWGIDTDTNREDVHKLWGKYPYIFQASTEAGIMAMQSWTRRGLTFVPYSNFYEFIPESEWLESKRDSSYKPRTLLLSEVRPGERYELVITSFNRMPFIRYRAGSLVRVTAPEDKEAQIKLPQVVFEAIVDDRIDVGDFNRLSEKTVARAIADSRLKSEEGTIRKEIAPNSIKDTLKSNNIKEVLVAANILPQFKHLVGKDVLCLNPANLQGSARRNAVSCIVDFSEDLKHEVTTNLTFLDLKERRKNRQDEPLDTLNLANTILDDGGQLTLVCVGSYNEAVVKKYLLCAKFADIRFGPGIISARKKEFVKYTFNGGQMTLEETTSPEFIRNIHNFAKELFKDSNFDIEIDDIFTPYSNFFVCYKTDSKEIVSFLRYTWHLPRHYLPCMLAVKVDDGAHIELEKPDEYSYAEIFSPYINSLSTLKAYKELMRNIVRHVLAVETKYAFTTISRAEPKSAEFYKGVFGFEDTGITLRYGDFDGEWGLLKGGKDSILQATRFFSKSAKNAMSMQT